MEINNEGNEMKINTTPSDYRTNSGAVGRIWQRDEFSFGWAHPDGSEGIESSWGTCEESLDAI